MVERSRGPAIAVVLVVLAGAGLFLGFVRKNGGGVNDAHLRQLQQAAARPDALPATWMAYAQALEQAAQFPRAAAAYQRVLETDPYNKTARLACASCLARAGATDPFYTFMHSTLLVDPKLTLNILGRPEAARFLPEARFQTLRKDAIAGSMD
ncbi:MAG TPA: tetratricopeptide repeat protein [Phycisphaerae bacterium]|nr:tetratricopeptide repeat protein [Phycisphaerae bacterium]